MDTDDPLSMSGLQSRMKKCLSIASTMSEGALLMKEEDAAILERGVRDSCSSGDTPLLAAMNPPSPTGLPMLDDDDLGSAASLPQITEVFRFQRDLRLHTVPEQRCSFRMDTREEEQAPEAIPISSIQLTLPQHAAEIIPNAGPARVVFRRCLSGDIRQGILTTLESNERTIDGSSIVVSPVSVAESSQPALSSVPQSTSGDEEDAFDEQVGIRKSKSRDRRMHEAAQFAEAVGELPPSQVNEVQEIIEEVESDSDDSQNEVHHHDQSSSHHATPATVPSEPTLECSASKSVTEGSNSKNPVNSADESFTQGDDGVAVMNTVKRPKTRPVWPFQENTSTRLFLHKLPEEVHTQDFVYKGICANPPEITKRGISRGNYAQLHRKAWLEVSDKYHRYGKNLRLYYRDWERLGFPTNQFFDWLDSKGEAAGQPLPNLPECPRSQLDSDTVLYITNPEITQKYSLSVVADEEGRGIVLDVDGDPVQTGSDGWIFVLRDSTLYGAQKITSVTGLSRQRFHHSSFFCGKAVAAAGIFLTNEDGIITRLYPHSGHYRPGEADMQRMLFYLHHNKINLRTLDMDTQQIFHVARQDTPTKQTDGEQSKEKKKKKVESLYLQPAVFVACFLAHKARFIGKGIFDQIHKIRKSDVTNVREALLVVNEEE